MAKIELILPKMGESVAEATIIKWLKNEGDKIDNDEFVVEIATDKVDSEVPSTCKGTLIKKLYNENDIVKVGEPFAIIETEATESSPVEINKPSSNTTKIKPENIPFTENIGKEQSVSFKESTSFFSPLVKSIAKEEQLSIQELESIQGTGNNNRVTKKDLLEYLKNKNHDAPTKEKQPTSKIETSTALEKQDIPLSLNLGEELIEMDRMRKLIANHMIESKRTSPHVTSFVEADVTDIVNQRNQIKNKFLEQHGQKLTFTPIFIKAIVDAIIEFPMINVSVNGNHIIKKNYINIGMATALPNGNLIVPVIKNADSLNLIGLAKAVNNLATKARENKLSPEDIQNGTYTVTNVGTFGNVMGTPIINQPQVAILALGAIRKVPAVIETDQGDLIGIRHKMFLSHSYDHRIVDGALGGMFVNKVAENLKKINLYNLS